MQDKRYMRQKLVEYYFSVILMKKTSRKQKSLVIHLRFIHIKVLIQTQFWVTVLCCFMFLF